jgi:hypothetical protein
MRAFIAGGTGFVGVNLANRLAERGWQVVVMGQTADRPRGLAGPVEVVAGDGRHPGPWQGRVSGSALVVNLAGATIFSRWTAETKQLIRESRVLTTRNLADAIDGGGKTTLFSTSAVGYYGFRGDEELDEAAPPGDDFLASVCREWEEAAVSARKKGVRVVTTRFGIVLGRNGGALGQMVPLFRRFVGGPLGSGRQWFSWIHMEDLLGAFSFLLERPEADGPYNLTAPGAVTNRELARALGRALHRPSFLPAPSLAIRLALGEFGNVLLKGQRAVPRRLSELGYGFRYPGIDQALASVV